MLLEGTQGELSESQRRALEVILRNALRLQGELDALSLGLDETALEQVIPAVGPAA